MNCPRCAGAVLEERERDGVTVDGCRVCYGIWLDRGELERLVARATREYDELERREGAPRPEPQPHQARSWRRDDDDDDDDRQRSRHDGRHGTRRKRWFETLGDFFD